MRPARLIEDAPLACRAVGPAVPWPDPLAFLDGVQRLQLLAYAGSAPLLLGEIAAAVRERQAGRLRTVVEARRWLAIGRPTALAAAADALEGLAELPLPDDEPAHPVRDLTQAGRVLDRARGALELEVGAAYRRRSDAWLVIDGALSESPDWAADPRALGVSKSHADAAVRRPGPRALSPFAGRTAYFGLRPGESERRAGARLGGTPLALGEPGPLPRPGAGRGLARPTAAPKARTCSPAACSPSGHRSAPPIRDGIACCTASTRWSSICAPAPGAWPEWRVPWLPWPTANSTAGRSAAAVAGAATAWDAALRGLSVALLERGDFGGATSAESLESGARGGPLSPAPGHRAGPGVGARAPRASPDRATLGATHAVRRTDVRARDAGPGDSRRRVHPAQRSDRGPEPGDHRSRPRRIPAAGIVSRSRVLEWFPEINQEGLTGAGVFYDGQLFNPPQARVGPGADRRPRRRGRRQLLRGGLPGAPGRPGHRRAGRGPARRGRVRGARPGPSSTPAGPYAEALLVRSGVRKARSVPFSRDMALVLKRRFVEGRALALQTKYHDPSAVLSRGPGTCFLVPWRGRTMVGVNSLIWQEAPDRLRVTENEVSDFRRRDRRGGSPARASRSMTSDW